MEAIAAEKLDEFGNASSWCFIQPPNARGLPRATAKHKRTTADSTDPTDPTATNPTDQIDTDTEDQTFAISVSDGGSESSDDDTDSDGIEEIGNEEVCYYILFYFAINKQFQGCWYASIKNHPWYRQLERSCIEAQDSDQDKIFGSSCKKEGKNIFWRGRGHQSQHYCNKHGHISNKFIPEGALYLISV
jgi:hypothetical protein